MFGMQVRTSSPAFLRSGLHHRSQRFWQQNIAHQAAADGGFSNNSDSKNSSGADDGNPPRVPRDVSAEADSNDKKPEKIPDSQWWPGVIVYATTNVAFIKIFEYSVEVSDIRVTIGILVAFYAVAYLMRILIRRVFKVSDKFPQFFWEGFPQRYKK